MPTVTGKSTITKVREGSPSLKTTIPETIIENVGFKKGDVLKWRLDYVGDDVILTVEKEAEKQS
ncbi:MAG: hypothetical protein QXJ74_06115 [Nitrososphaera sp.]